MSLRTQISRILFRKRFFGTVSICEKGTESYSNKKVDLNDYESVDVFDRCNKYLDSQILSEKLDFASKVKQCETVSEICDLFKENRGTISLNDHILLLSKVIQINSIAIRSKHIDLNENIQFEDGYNTSNFCSKVDYFPPVDFCSVSLNNFKPVNVKRMDIRVSEIFMDIINKFSHLNVDQILYLNRMCDFLKGYHKRVIRSSSEDRIGPMISHMEPIELLRTGIVLASRSENVDFVKLYITELFEKINLLENQEKIIIFKVMSNSKKCSSIFLSCFAEYLTYLSKLNYSTMTKASDSDSIQVEFNAKEYIMFLSKYANNPKCISKELFKYLLAKCLVVDLSELELNDVMDLVWISNKLENVDLFLPKAKDYLVTRIKELGPNPLTMLIWSYSNSSIGDKEFHKLLEDSAIRISDQLTPKNISLCCYGLSLKSSPFNENPFHSHIEGDIINNIIYFNGLDLAMVASAYSRILSGSSVLHQCIQESVINYSEELPADCITKVLYSYARIAGKRSLFNSFIYSVFERIHQFPIHEFIKVLWSYLVMRFYDHKFWVTSIEVVTNNFDLIINDRRCFLLYPVIKIVTQLNILPLNNDLTRLMNHTRKSFWDNQDKNEITQHILNVFDSIPKVEDVSVDCIEEYFLVDLSFKIGQTQYALVVYNRSNMFNQSPTGEMRLKELFLENKGYKIVRILEEIWSQTGLEGKIEIIKSQI